MTTKEQARRYSLDYYHRNRDAQRARMMRYKYKRSEEDYERVLAEQAGGCAVCGRPPFEISAKTGLVKRLAWDHDHSCCPGKVTCGGCVRGLVCTACNRWIGKLERGELDAHMEYLEKWT